MLTPRTLALLPVVALVAAACGAAAPAAPPPAPTTPAAIATPASAAPADPIAPAAGGTPAAALEPWQTATLADVRTGESFTIADLAGSVVVMEPMAIWCPNCLRQQKAAAKALATLEGEDVVYISLGVDPSERPADLAAYADEHGFDWRFVVADRDLSRLLARSLGDQVLSPPSTPRITITPDGQVVGPDFGMADAATIEAEIRAHLS